MYKQLVAIILASFFILMTLAGCQEPPQEKSADTATGQNELKPSLKKLLNLSKRE